MTHLVPTRHEHRTRINLPLATDSAAVLPAHPPFGPIDGLREAKHSPEILAGCDLFADRNPRTLSPSPVALRLMSNVLGSGRRFTNNHRYAIVKGLDRLIEHHGLKPFDGELPKSAQDLSDTTKFLQRWLPAAYEMFKEQNGEPGTVGAGYLAIDGYGGTNNSRVTKGSGTYKGTLGYFRASFIAIRRDLQRLVTLAAGAGETIHVDSLWNNAVQGTAVGSTKLPHVDAYITFVGLQKYSSGVSGGYTTFTDLGAFCADSGIPPWRLLVPYATPLESIPDEARQHLRHPPYVALVPRPEFQQALKEYEFVVPAGNGDIIVFNNRLDIDPISGKIELLAHGATPVQALTELPRRTIINSFAHEGAAP